MAEFRETARIHRETHPAFTSPQGTFESSLARTTARLAIQYKNGYTAKHNPSHRTFSIPVKPDITPESCRVIVDAIRPMIASEITKVRLVGSKITRVWGPEMRVEQQQRTASVEKKQETKQAVQTQQQIAPVQGVSTPVAEYIEPVQAPAAIIGEEIKHPEATTETTTETPQEEDLSYLLKGTVYDPDPATRAPEPKHLSFMEQARANNYVIHLEDLYKNPFAHTVAHEGQEATIEKIDVPIYAEQQQ